VHWRLVTVGRPAGPWAEAATAYLERLRPVLPIEWRPVRQSRRPPAERPAEEGRRLLAASEGSLRILLDERGPLLTSRELAGFVGRLLAEGARPAFLVGGPYGVDDATRRAADRILSLSPLTFPHDVVPALLLEQLYRSLRIVRGEPYHH
jgi:23S rRNA (pseudouridine1915-N3)-methyltransferase